MNTSHSNTARKLALASALPMISVSLAALIGASDVQAQPRLEEVIVTAQKRSQSLQDVPVAVTAIGGEKMQAMGIRRMDDLTAYTPGVTVTEGAAGAQLFIRGVGSGLNKGFEESVATYIDGVYYGRGRSSRNGMVDMERVEILKGPQGILFGKNTIAGVMNLTTRNPGTEWEGYAQLGYEFETEEQSYEAAWGGPITDTFGARLAVRYADMEGWMKNTWTGQNIGEEDDQVIRLSTVWQPLDTLEVITKLQYSKLRQNEKTAVLAKCSPAMQGLVAGVDDCRFDDKTTVTAYDPDGGYGKEMIEASSAAITVNWDVADHTLTSVTGFTKHRDIMYIDSDYTHLDILAADRDEYYEAFSQEIRLASDTGNALEYLVGAFFEASELDFDGRINFTNAPLGGAAALSAVNDNSQETESIALFGQATWHITEQFSLTAGGRYAEDEKDAVMNRYCAFYKTFTPSGLQAGCFGQTFSREVSRTDRDFSPTVIAEWRPTADHMFYAKYSEGYKSGGFDLQSGSPSLDAILFAPEEVRSFEIGSKSTLLDGAMTLNMAVFRNEYEDLQVSTFDGTANFTVGNAAEAISQGIDADLNWALSDTLTTSLSLSYLDAYYDSYPEAQCTTAQQIATPVGCVQDLSGDSLQYAPKWSGHWNLTWEQPLADQFLLTLASDINFSSDFITVGTLDPELEQDSYYKWDLRASLAPLDGPWEVALVGRNLTDEKTFHFGNAVPLSPGSFFKHLDRPRTVALQASWKF